MAQRHINVKNGVVALPTGFNGVFNGFDTDESVAVEDVTVFGAAVYGLFLSNGTPVQQIVARGFTNHGAATTTPGFGGSGIQDADGAAATFTYDTGTTLAGSYIVSRITTNHDRKKAAVPTVWTCQNAGDITATWAAS